MLTGYLRQRRRTLLAFFLFGGIFAAAFALYQLPLRAVAYPFVLCAAAGAVLLALDYRRVLRQHRQLELLRQLPEELADALPPADTVTEADYRSLVILLAESRRAIRTQEEQRYGDMVDYYTMWAHQIKTPIASMRLTLQNEDSDLARSLSGDLMRVEQYVEMVMVFLRLGSTTTDYVIRAHSLTEVLKKNAGRNSYGHITVRHRGGGEKRKYRIIDFKRDKVDMEATVLRLEYDPNRSANIALVQYEDGEKRYIIAPVGLTAGDKVLSSAAADIKPGNCLPIANIPVGTVIHNVEMHPGKGAQLVRSAGAYAQLMAKDGDNAQIRMPSGEVRIIRTNCTACIGQVGNLEHENVQIGKAGRKRHMGWRPTVRGSVMNPCDHPHGGGEGKSPVGRPGPVTPWGKPALGYKTRKTKNRNDKFIVKRRNVK